MQAIDLTGQRFGKWTVVRDSGKRIRRRPLWVCKCDCGSEGLKYGESLRAGKSTRCRSCCPRGLASPNYKGYQAISGVHWRSIERGAIRRSINFNLTIEQVWQIYLNQQGKCALSGLDLRFDSTCDSRDGNASLDRIDSDRGYTIDNVQWVHKDVNLMKMDLNQSRFIDLCKAIAFKWQNN